MPLSPSFPDWLLKRDPTLAGALTNPLFLAFELRRVQQGSGRFAAFKANPTGPLIAVTPLFFLLLGLLANFIFPGACCCFVIIGVIVSRVLSHIFQRSKSEVYWVPTELGTAISEAHYAPVLRDLWMTPNAPKDYAEALVLEGWMKCHLWVGLISSIPLMGLMTFVFVTQQKYGPKIVLTSGDWILMCAFAIFVLRSERLCYPILRLRQLRSAKHLIKQAAGDKSLSYSLWRIIAGILIPFCIVYFIWAANLSLGVSDFLYARLVDPISSMADVWISDHAPLRAIRTVVRRDAVQLALTGVLTGLILATNALSRLAWEIYAKHYAEFLEYAEQKIPIFFDRVLER